MRRRLVHWLACALGAAWSLAVQAQTVELAGLTAGRALLVIDGGAPRFVTAGESVAGVRVVSVASDQAVVEVGGERRTLQLGGGPVAASSPASTRRITLMADSGGHFTSTGQINGQTGQFLVDTGATVLTLSEAQAGRIGLNYRAGQRIRVKTANGEISGHQLQLNSVSVGGHTTYNVAAVVLPAELPYVLLGNSFLSRFKLLRDGGQMTLVPND